MARTRLRARAGDRETTASSLLAEACAERAHEGVRALVIDDHGGEAERRLAAAGARPACWRRWAFRLAREEDRGVVHAPSPPEGPFDLVALRRPRERRSFEMQLHLAAGRLAPSGRLLVVGANDEGIKSAPRLLSSLFETVDVAVNRRRMRVLEVCGPRAGARPRARVEEWSERVEAGGLDLVSYPGVFAEGRLDDASALLIDALQDAELPSRVLDFGCGHGVLSCLLAARGPAARFTMLDVDALALHAAAQNLPGARPVLSPGWEGLDPGERFGLIVSNPPIHRGRDEDFSVLEALVRAAPERLDARGRLVLVVQRTVGAGGLLRTHLGAVRKLAETPRFQVWAGRAG